MSVFYFGSDGVARSEWFASYDNMVLLTGVGTIWVIADVCSNYRD